MISLWRLQQRGNTKTRNMATYSCIFFVRRPRLSLNTQSIYLLYTSKRGFQDSQNNTGRKILGLPGSPSAMEEKVWEEEEFRTLHIPGHNPVSRQDFKRLPTREEKMPRSSRMAVDQDWTNTWPTAKVFNWSAVPVPMRQGRVYGMADNNGIIPEAFANIELMKIPNFLHLTPLHVQKHCAALKQFCTKWPNGLYSSSNESLHESKKYAIEEYFPIEVIRRSYVHDGASQRDDRAKLVTMKMKLSALNLDNHARDKIKRLLGKCYDPSTDLITLEADRCPTKVQNYEYLQYLLNALYFESWETEAWEVKSPEDCEVYEWHVQPSYLKIKQAAESVAKAKLATNVDKTAVEDQRVETLNKSKDAVEDLFNKGDHPESIQAYKNAMKQLLLGESVAQ